MAAENSLSEMCLENSIVIDDVVCLEGNPLEITSCPDIPIVDEQAENQIENVCLENSIENVCLVENSIENVCLVENSIKNDSLKNLPANVNQKTVGKTSLAKDLTKTINRAYRTLWEKEEEFEGWLTKGSSPDKAYCRWCKKEFRAHKSTLIAHATSESHKRVAATTGPPQNEITFVNIATINGTPLTKPLPAKLHTPIEPPKPNNDSTPNLSYLPFSSRKGQIIGSGQKRLIINLYMYKLKVRKIPKYHIPAEIHVETGLGLRSIKEIIKEYLMTGTVKSPTRKRPNCRNCYEKLNATQIEMIKRKIQQYFGQKEVPTINKMLEDVNADPDLPSFKKTSFHRVLHHLGYEWVRRGRNRLLVEQKELKAWKEKYLEYRTDGLDETWLNVTDAAGKSDSDE